MRSTIIITKRGPGYISDVAGQHGGGHKGARCGLTPFEAAARAAQLMIEYAQSNPEGGNLMAPPEIMELVPEHLRSITAHAKSGAADIPVLSELPTKGFLGSIVRLSSDNRYYLYRQEGWVLVNNMMGADQIVGGTTSIEQIFGLDLAKSVDEKPE